MKICANICRYYCRQTSKYSSSEYFVIFGSAFIPNKVLKSRYSPATPVDDVVYCQELGDLEIDNHPAEGLESRRPSKGIRFSRCGRAAALPQREKSISVAASRPRAPPSGMMWTFRGPKSASVRAAARRVRILAHRAPRRACAPCSAAARRPSARRGSGHRRCSVRPGS